MSSTSLTMSCCQAFIMCYVTNATSINFINGKCYINFNQSHRSRSHHIIPLFITALAIGGGHTDTDRQTCHHYYNRIIDCSIRIHDCYIKIFQSQSFWRALKLGVLATFFLSAIYAVKWIMPFHIRV